MLDQLGNGLLLGIIISVASVALSLLYGVTRIVNFAHGEIIALGAIMTLFFSSPVDYRVLFLDKYSPLGYNFALSCILAVFLRPDARAATASLPNNIGFARLFMISFEKKESN